MTLFPSLTAEKFPRQIWGLRFKWPAVWEWVALTVLILAAFTGVLGAWVGVAIAVAWGIMFFRTGIPLNYTKPLRVFLLLVVSQLLLNALVVGLALGMTAILR